MSYTVELALRATDKVLDAFEPRKLDLFRLDLALDSCKILHVNLSIVIPAHNEAFRIGRLLDLYLPFFVDRYGQDVEFIVVINGTTDETQKVVEGYMDDYGRLLVLNDPNPIGKGGAVMMGFRAAKGDYVGYVDADGATPPEAFSDLVDQARDCHAVIASRWCKGAIVHPRQPFVRRCASRVFNLMTRILFGLRLSDTQCGAKMFHRDVIDMVIDRIGITKWAFDVDLLFQVKRAGFVIKETPTAWSDIEGSKIAVTESSLEMLAALVRLRLVYSPLKWIVSLYDRFLGSQGSSDRLLRHSVLVGVGSQVSNAANMLFQIVMAHMLVGGDAVEYGVLSSMLGAVFMLSFLFDSLGRSVSHFAAIACRENRREVLLPMARSISRDVALFGLLPLILLLFLSPYLAEGFHLSTATPLVFMMLTVAVRLFLPVCMGILSGMQAFRSVAMMGALLSMLRLIAGVLLVLAGFGATGALCGNFVGTAIVLAVSVFLLMRMLPASRETYAPSVKVRRYFISFALAGVGYSLLTSSDVVLVKRFFEPDLAGRYALVAMIARMVFFLPMPIAVAMFPKVVSNSGRSVDASRTFRKAMLATITVLIVSAAAIECFPSFFIRFLTSGDPVVLTPLLRLLVVAYLPFPIFTLLLNYELAQGRALRVAWPMLAAAVIYILLAKFLHGGLERIIYTLGGASYSCGIWFLVSGLLTSAKRRRIAA